MSDWTKLQLVAECQRALGEIQIEIIERQTHTSYSGPIRRLATDTKRSLLELIRDVLEPETAISTWPVGYWGCGRCGQNHANDITLCPQIVAEKAAKSVQFFNSYPVEMVQGRPFKYDGRGGFSPMSEEEIAKIEVREVESDDE